MQLWRRIHPSLHPMQNQQQQMQQTPVTWTNLVSRPTTALQSSSSSVTIHLTAGLTARGSYKCTTNNRQQRQYTIMSSVQHFYNHHPQQAVSQCQSPSVLPALPQDVPVPKAHVTRLYFTYLVWQNVNSFERILSRGGLIGVLRFVTINVTA